MLLNFFLTHCCSNVTVKISNDSLQSYVLYKSWQVMSEAIIHFEISRIGLHSLHNGFYAQLDHPVNMVKWASATQPILKRMWNDLLTCASVTPGMDIVTNDISPCHDIQVQVTTFNLQAFLSSITMKNNNENKYQISKVHAQYPMIFQIPVWLYIAQYQIHTW